MESLIQVFRMEQISIQTRIRIIVRLGRALNMQFGGNFTEPVVYELVLALDPQSDIITDERYTAFIND